MVRARWHVLYAIVVCFFIADRGVKIWVRTLEAPVDILGNIFGETIRIAPVVNDAIAWSIPVRGALATALSVGILIVAVGVLSHFIRIAKPFGIFAVLFVIAGGLSNLLDRIRFGGVIDYVQTSFFPAFNLADVAITLGALLILFALAMPKKHLLY